MVDKKKFLVSIVIPNYQRFDLLRKCLDAIPDAMEDIPYEIILVENGSSRKEAMEFFSSYPLPENLQVVKLTKNIGFPAAVNRGVKSATSPLIFLLTNDVILDPGSGVPMVMDMDNPEIGIVGMKLRFPSDIELSEASLVHGNGNRPAERVQHIGLFTNLRGQIFHMYLGWSVDNPRVCALREVYAVTGAAFMTRRKLWHKVGGMDEVFGKGCYEDIDLCLKLREAGLMVVVNQKATAKHYTGATAEQSKEAFPLNQNRIIFEQKWYNKLMYTEWKAW